MLINPLPYMADIQEPLTDTPVKDKLPFKECRSLVDADMFVYAAGFSVEHREPLAYDKDGKFLGQWSKKSKFNEYCKKHPEFAAKVADVDIHFWIEEFDKCRLILQNKKKQITAISRHSPQKWFLTKGATLWRNEDATIQKYKGCRDNMEKPVYYDDIRDFMVDKFHAHVCEGLEADDSIAATARNEIGRVIVFSGDKDLRTVAGYQCNTGKLKEGIFYVTPLQACRNLYIQMLMGDRIDHIKGLSGDKQCRGYGIKTATKAIEQFITEYDMAKFVASEYQKKYPDGVMAEDGITHLTWQEMLVETANLLFLRRYHHTQFTWED
ncbi:hypothetical protein ABMA84_15845 [Halobacteriovorax sp. XZX-2]|uniref:hypothetical protein n=1 Tax=Halobacteriovorax sp. XZX-2 TaxID=3157721 RepID=UPI0037118128